MFCPTCGVDSPEGHKFCKACGTNLQVVSDAIKDGGDTLGQLRLDLDGLKRTFASSGKAIRDEARRAVRNAKYGGRRRGRHWGNWEGWQGWPAGQASQSGDNTRPVTQESVQAPTTEELTMAGPSGLPRGLPRPKEWLRYSKQRNIRDGLVSLLAGGGFGFFLYYLGVQVMNSGSIDGIAASSHVHDLDKLLRTVIPLLWLLSAPTILKGIGQLFYGLFFAESISKIAAAFGAAIRPTVAPPREIASAPSAVTSPKTSWEKAGDYTTGSVPSPASVTENTTNILEKA